MAHSDESSFQFQLDEFYLDLQEDGSKISVLTEDAISKGPFPGIRPFKTSECQLFKGRGGQEEELIKRLKKNHFLAVIGSSGTGKSSLVRAGLIPQLFGGYLHKAGNNWNIAICRPGKDPIASLAVAISSVMGRSKERQIIAEHFAVVEPMLSNSVYGILDANELLNSGNSSDANLLIIVDQFEELFRFDRKGLGRGNVESHFVNLLLKASLNTSGFVYVIITMRSEFLGDCVKYRGLAEAINDGQYLVPQLTRNQLTEVIEDPISLGHKKIDNGLVELLINEIDEGKIKENLDQLPILQHALMRTYNRSVEQKTNEITVEDYEAIGGMRMALANHAELKYKELADADSSESNPSKKQKIAKLIFQALTDLSTNEKGGRRPIELGKIYGIAKSIDANEGEVNQIIDHFRDRDTSFIMPPEGTNLYAQLIVDISHESLMRNWDRLNNWIMEEVKFGKLYKALNDRRELSEQAGMEDEWIRGGLLEEMLAWRKKYPINAFWASRYHSKIELEQKNETDEGLYSKNLDFLKNSQEQLRLEKRKEGRRKRYIIAVFAIASIISIAFGLTAIKEAHSANEQKKKAIAARDSSKALAKIVESDKQMMKIRDDKLIKTLRLAKTADSTKNVALEKADVAHQQADKMALERGIQDYYMRHLEKRSDTLEKLAIQLRVSERNFHKAAYSYALTRKKWWNSDLDSVLNARLVDTLFDLRFPNTGTDAKNSEADKIEKSLVLLNNANDSEIDFPLYSYLLSVARDTNNNMITGHYIDSITKYTIPYQHTILLQSIDPSNIKADYQKSVLKFVFQSSNKFVAGNSHGFFYCDVNGNQLGSKIFPFGDNEIAVAIADSANKFLSYDLGSENFIVNTIVGGREIDRYVIERIKKNGLSFQSNSTRSIKGVFSHDGRFLALYDGKDVFELYDLVQKKNRRIGCQNPVRGFEFSRDDKMFLMYDNASASVADFHNHNVNDIKFKKPLDLNSSTYFKEANLLKGSFITDTTVSLISNRYIYFGNINKSLEHKYSGNYSLVNYFKVSTKDDDITAKAFDGARSSIEITQGEKTKYFPWHSNAITDLQISDDGSTVISGDSKNIYVWNTRADMVGMNLKQFVKPDKLSMYIYNKGEAFYRDSDYAAAADFYNKAVVCDPGNAKAWYKLGRIANETKKYKLANQQFKEAAEIDGKNVEYLTALGNSYFYHIVISYSLADSVYKLAFKLDSTNANLWNEAGVLLSRQGKYKLAIEKYKRSFFLDSTDATVLRNLAGSYYQAHEYVLGDQLYEKVMKMDSSAKSWNDWGDDQFTAKMYAKSIEKYKKALEQDSENTTYLSNLGRAYYEIKEYKLGMDCFEKSLKNDQKNALHWNDWGISFDHSNNFSQAIEKYKKAIDLDFKDAAYRSNLIRIYYRNKQYREGDTLLYGTLKIDVSNSELVGLLGERYRKTQKYDLALQQFDQQLKLDSITYSPLLNLASFYIEKDEKNRALMSFQQALRKVKEFEWVSYNEISIAANRLNEYPIAKQYADTSILLDDKNPNSYAHRGYANLKMGFIDECKTDLDKALSIDPVYPKTYFYYACYYAAKNDIDNVLKNLKIAIDKGFDEPYWITSEEYFSAIKNDQRYIALLSKLRNQLKE